MIKEHDIVVLTEDLLEEGLTDGDIGTVVHVHKNGEGYEVEFMTLAGQTIAVASLLAEQAISSRQGAKAQRNRKVRRY